MREYPKMIYHEKGHTVVNDKEEEEKLLERFKQKGKEEGKDDAKDRNKTDCMLSILFKS